MQKSMVYYRYKHKLTRSVIPVALVNTTEMFKKAYANGYAIGAFNVNNMEIVQGITEACSELNAPVILQVSAGARKYANHTYLLKLVEAAVKENPHIPMALHLDHGDTFELCKDCVDGGFTSVMIDGSHHDYEDNVALTRKVVEYAHAHGVTVEGELGRLAGIEDDVNVSDEDASYTNPAQVQDFVERTGVDSLAIAIGTSHGAYKFKPGQKPQLRFDILQEVSERLPGFPIVLHGASSVIPEFVEMINANGGNMPGATIAPDKTFFDLEIDAFKKVVDLNLFGTVLPTMVFAGIMVDQKKGSIVNFCSESALRPLTRVVGYGTAKAAIANFTKYMAGELALKFGDGLRVNAIAPGFFLTDQNRALLTNPDGSLTDRSKTILAHTPFGRFGEPEDLYGTIQYLISDASKFVTGTVAVIDGGFDAFSI